MPKVIDVNIYNKKSFRYFSKKQIQEWFTAKYPKYKQYLLNNQGVKPLNDIESIEKAFRSIGQKTDLNIDKLMERLKIHMMENLKKKNLEEAKLRGTIKAENIKKAEEKISKDVKTPDTIKISSKLYKPFSDRTDIMKKERGPNFIDYQPGESWEDAQDKRGDPVSGFYDFLYDSIDKNSKPIDIRNALNSVAYINSISRPRLNGSQHKWDFKSDIRVDVFRVKELQLLTNLLKKLNMIKKVNYKNKAEYINVLSNVMSQPKNVKIYDYLQSLSEKYL